MSNLQTWSKNKHPSVALMAIMYAGLAEDFSRIISKSKDPRTLAALGQIAKIPLHEWLSYYTKRRLYLQLFSSLLGNEDELETILISKNTAQDLLKKQLESPPTAEAIPETFFQAMSGDSNIFDTLELNSNELLRSLVFMIQVALPCYYLYLKQPGQLLKEARHGNLDSLEELLRLDSSALFDRKIASRLHDLRYSKPAEFSRLIDCANKPTKRKVTPQKFKVFIASGISYYAQCLNAPLTEPEMRALFDAFAKDREQGEIDPDLPESPHSLYMAMKRDLPFWESLNLMPHKS